MQYVEYLELIIRLSELDFYHDVNLPLEEKVQKTLNKIFFIF